jgi:hypothetical protein
MATNDLPRLSLIQPFFSLFSPLVFYDSKQSNCSELWWPGTSRKEWGPCAQPQISSECIREVTTVRFPGRFQNLSSLPKERKGRCDGGR